MSTPRILSTRPGTSSLLRSLLGFLTIVFALLGISTTSRAALTPTFVFTGTPNTTTYSEGSGVWMSTLSGSASYHDFFAGSTPGTTAAGNYSNTITQVVQFGGSSSGTAGLITVGSTAATTTKPPVAGAIIIANANNGANGYTFTGKASGTIAQANAITINGVADGATTYGIYMTITAQTTTFTNSAASPLTSGGGNIVLAGSQTWANMNTAAGVSLNNYMDVSGAFNLTTMGSILLGGSNSFANLTIGSGTTTVNNNAGLTGFTTKANNSLNLSGTVAVNSGATLLVSSATNAVSMVASAGGNLIVNDAGSITMTNLTGTLGANVTIGSTNSGGSTAYLTNSVISTPLSLGTLSLTNNAVLAYYISSPITASGAVTFAGVNNLINLSGGAISQTTNIITGSTINGANASTISVTGAAVGGSTIAWGSSNTVGRTVYAVTNTATALQINVSGGAWNLLWSGAQDSVWNYTSTNWQTNSAGVGTGSNIVTVANDNETFGSAASVAIGSGGVTAGTLVTTNSGQSGTVAFTGANTLTVAGGMTNSGSGGVTVGSPLTIAGSLTVNGGGTTTLSGISTITGGVIVTNASTLNINATGDSVTGGIRITGQGTATIGAAGDLTGTTATVTLTNGTLNLGGFTDSPSAGGIALSGSGTISNGTLTLGTGQTVTNTTGANVISANLDGTNGAVVTVAASSTLTLSGANTTFGGFIVNNGTLKAGNGSFGTATITNNNGGIVDLNGQSVANTITNNAGTNYLINSSSGTGTLTGTMNSTYFEVNPGNNNVYISGTVNSANRFSVTNGLGQTGMLMLGGPIVMANNKSLFASNNGIMQFETGFSFNAQGNYKVLDGEIDLNGQQATGYLNANIGNSNTAMTNLYNSSASTPATFGATGLQLFIGGSSANGSNAIVGAASGALLTIASQIRDTNAVPNSTLIIAGAGTVSLTGTTNGYQTNQVNRFATEVVGSAANLGTNGAVVAGYTVDLNIFGKLTVTNAFTLGSFTTININNTTGTVGGNNFGTIGTGGILTYNGVLNLNLPASGITSVTDNLFTFSSSSGNFTSATLYEAANSWNMTNSLGIWTATDTAGNRFNLNTTTGALTVAAVPEPGTCAMVGLGISALAVTIIRRRRND